MARSYPAGLPARYHAMWDKPWSRQAALSRGFHLWCWRHGLVSPHFTRAEWGCHDGTPVPASLRRNAQRHAFNMEKFRQALGGVAIPVISAYRDDAYNRQIHGAKASRHVKGDATDVSKEWVDQIGHQRIMAAANKVFANGGVGVYPSGSMHLDSRGFKARWSSFVGW